MILFDAWFGNEVSLCWYAVGLDGGCNDVHDSLCMKTVHDNRPS